MRGCGHVGPFGVACDKAFQHDGQHGRLMPDGTRTAWPVVEVHGIEGLPPEGQAALLRIAQVAYRTINRCPHYYNTHRWTCVRVAGHDGGHWFEAGADSLDQENVPRNLLELAQAGVNMAAPGPSPEAMKVARTVLEYRERRHPNLGSVEGLAFVLDAFRAAAYPPKPEIAWCGKCGALVVVGDGCRQCFWIARCGKREEALIKLLDGCFCDDGRDLPECARCLAIRAALAAGPNAPATQTVRSGPGTVTEP